MQSLTLPELTKITDPLGNTTFMSYNNLGMTEKITDAKGKSTSYNYDIIGRVSGVTDPMGGLTKYFYDLSGNLSMLIDPKNNMIRYEYDERDRLKKIIDQLGRTETYTYDTNDNLKTITDRKGQTTSYTRDLMNRPTKITYHDGSFTDYTYDKAGRADYINDSISGFIDPTYNDFGCSNCSGRGLDRISKEVTPLGTIDYTYDKAGRRITMTVAGQNVVNYVYDAAGRMTSIAQKIGNSTKTYPLTYDNGSRRTTLKIPTSSKNKYVTTTYGYDTANRLLSMVQQGPSAQIENLIYEYDPNGNRTKFTRNSVQPLRNGVTEASYDDANEMLTFTPVSSIQKNMIYDNNGNLTSVINDCGTTNYTWDVRNRLTGISGFKADCSSMAASFKYDAFGRRIEKTISGTTTKYLYDSLDIIQEKNQSGAVTANYIRTQNIDEPLTRISGSTTRHYVTDALGSVIALTDDSGVVKTTYTYDPFGNVTVSGEVSDNPFQYTGRENDGTGLYYYRARYYSPDLQRFISEDPIGLAGGINFYAYVGNNPINFVDPLGLLTEVVVWQPVGWGKSSFGHVSVNINGTTYSYSPSGMNILPTDQYLGINNFREGVGMVLNITDAQEAFLNNYLKNYSKEYGRLKNNCGDPIESGLEKLGYDMGALLFPVSLGNTLMDLGIVGNYNFYPATQPKKGTSAPWAR